MDSNDTDSSSPSKRRKVSDGNHKCQNDNTDELLPGLPDHLAQVCLARVNPSTLFAVRRSWRRLIYTPSFPPFLALYVLLSRPGHNSLHLHAFDPIAGAWRSLPPPPTTLRLLLRHPSFLSRRLPVQSLSVSGRKLLLLAASTHALSPALPRPLAFDPLAGRWSVGPALAAPRRWCAAGALRGSAYVASGIGSQFSHGVARSVERWPVAAAPEASPAGWERAEDLKDGRFSREAIDAVGWRGKLCMVNVKGGLMKDGVVYDAARRSWEQMPLGMLIGWRGPAAAMDEEEMFVVEESEGVLMRYIQRDDQWEEVAQSEKLKGAEHLAAGGGRVCVVCHGGRKIIVVDVATDVGKMWEVDAPPGLEALAVHILPRMNTENPV